MQRTESSARKVRPKRKIPLQPGVPVLRAAGPVEPKPLPRGFTGFSPAQERQARTVGDYNRGRAILEQAARFFTDVSLPTGSVPASEWVWDPGAAAAQTKRDLMNPYKVGATAASFVPIERLPLAAVKAGTTILRKTRTVDEAQRLAAGAKRSRASGYENYANRFPPHHPPGTTWRRKPQPELQSDRPTIYTPAGERASSHYYEGDIPEQLRRHPKGGSGMMKGDFAKSGREMGDLTSRAELPSGSVAQPVDFIKKIRQYLRSGGFQSNITGGEGDVKPAGYQPGGNYTFQGKKHWRQANVKSPFTGEWVGVAGWANHVRKHLGQQGTKSNVIGDDEGLEGLPFPNPKPGMPWYHQNREIDWENPDDPTLHGTYMGERQRFSFPYDEAHLPPGMAEPGRRFPDEAKIRAALQDRQVSRPGSLHDAVFDAYRRGPAGYQQNIIGPGTGPASNMNLPKNLPADWWPSVQTYTQLGKDRQLEDVSEPVFRNRYADPTTDPFNKIGASYKLGRPSPGGVRARTRFRPDLQMDYGSMFEVGPTSANLVGGAAGGQLSPLTLLLLAMQARGNQ